MQINTVLFLGVSCVVLAACTTPLLSPTPEATHLSQTDQKTIKGTPPPAITTPPLAPLAATPKMPRYSVKVQGVRIEEVLFALAEDAKLNLDLSPEVAGLISFHAVDQTLPQILSRLAKTARLRFAITGNHLLVEKDTPYLKHYQVNYLNMTREVSGTVATNTQISTSALASDTNLQGSNSNVSRIEIKNSAKNQFWVSLEKNIRELLQEEDKVLPEGSSETVTQQENSQQALGVLSAAKNQKNTKAATRKNTAAQTQNLPQAASLQSTGNTIVRHSTFREAALVIAHPETGVVSVRATGEQHEKVQAFLDQVMGNARRQVLIEATIVEVQLSEGYQQGIDWSRMREDGSGFSLATPGVSANVSGAITPFVLKYTNNALPLNIAGTLKLLESFGSTKVLSSPKLSVLNNQTATLKVSEEFVYFLVKTDIAAGNANTNPITAVTTTPQSVSVGLFMSVTPQISEEGIITLNVRPSISSISDLKPDPNPSIPQGMQNLVPQIRTREIESVMRLESGDIAVLGGLMEDRMDNMNGRLPIIGAIPLLGELFTARNNASRRSELVIFLRPTQVRENMTALADKLPSDDFFQARARFTPALSPKTSH